MHLPLADCVEYLTPEGDRRSRLGLPLRLGKYNFMGIDAATTYQNDRVVALFRAKKEGQPLPWMKGEWPFRGGGSVPAALHLTVEPSLYLRTSPIHLVPQKGLEPDTSSPLGCPGSLLALPPNLTSPPSFRP